MFFLCLLNFNFVFVKTPFSCKLQSNSYNSAKFKNIFIVYVPNVKNFILNKITPISQFWKQLSNGSISGFALHILNVLNSQDLQFPEDWWDLRSGSSYACSLCNVVYITSFTLLFLRFQTKLKNLSLFHQYLPIGYTRYSSG